MEKRLALSFEKLGDAGDMVVKFNGEFDKAGYGEIQDELGKFVNDFAGTNLIFDLGELKFINSEGIGYFMSVYTHLVTANKKLILIGPNAHVADVFNAVGIMEIVPIFNSVNDFLNKK